MLAADRTGDEGRAFDDAHAFEDLIHQSAELEIRDFRTSTRLRICSALRRTGLSTITTSLRNAPSPVEATTLSAQAASAGAGAKPRMTGAICRGWMQSLPAN